MKKTFSTLIATMLAASTFAVPAYRGALKAKQPDGTTITFYMTGDEHRHACVSIDGYRLMQDDKGFYRYASQTADLRLTTAGSPIAHDPLKRSADEMKYVKQLRLAKDFTPTPRQLVAKALPQRAAQDGSAGKASRYQIGDFPTKGQGRFLVLLVQFADKSFTLDNTYHQRMLNEAGFSDNGATGSAADYYKAQSNGQFEPTFDVIGPISLTRPSSYYGQNDTFGGSDVNAGKMIEEACRKADSDLGVDFSQYDGDGNGTVDMVYVIYAGYGEHAGGGANTIWPHKYQLSGYGISLNLDGKSIDTYACSSELFSNAGTQSSGIGTVCHEFGHVLGLADHYNTTDGTDYKLGAYDIMDYGSYNNDGNTPPAYNAFERMSLGWLTPDRLNQRADALTLYNIEESNKAYLVPTSNPDEFYMLENRQQAGWDKYLKGSGMMITHIDYNETVWTANTVNNDISHPRFCIVPADNELAYDAVTARSTEAYDLYPAKGNDSFTDTSTPAAKPYTGETLDRWVTGITNQNGTVEFDFMANHLAVPAGVKAEDMGGGSLKASWEGVDKAEAYDLALYKVDFRSAEKTALGEGFGLMSQGTPDNPSATNIASSLDKYMSTAGWTGRNVFQAGGWCQIGTQNDGGELVSPEFNAKRFDGQYAVVVKAKSLKGKQPVLSVASNGQTGRTRITSTERTYMFCFKGGISKTTVQIGTNTERALIDTLAIVRGDATGLYPDAKVVSVSGEPATTEGDVPDNDFVRVETVKTVEGVAATEYTFTQLETGVYYAVAVKATSAEASSDWTADCVAYIDNKTGINSVGSESTSKALVFTIDGKAVANMARPGIYIVKKGNTVRKVVRK